MHDEQKIFFPKSGHKNIGKAIVPVVNHEKDNIADGFQLINNGFLSLGIVSSS